MKAYTSLFYNAANKKDGAMSAEQSVKVPVLPRNMVIPFILVTSLFALWGFANDITNPMVAAFKKILLISNFESSLVQFAFYGGYCVMAVPAAIFIKRYSYKSGILIGLALYAAAALSFPIAGHMMAFWAFLLAYFVMTCGLSFLETTSNPYILAMGPEETSTQRLNLAQSFNPMGSLTGMFIASNFILNKLFTVAPGGTPAEEEAARQALSVSDPQKWVEVQQFDLGVLQVPYFAIGLVVLAVLLVFIFKNLPKAQADADQTVNLIPTLKRLLVNKKYMEGVVAQAFYVGAQIMCWTFIIQYAANELGMAQDKAQNYNIIAMIIFCSSRFVCTFLLKFISPGGLLGTLAVAAIGLVTGVILIPGMLGLYCLIGVSACMSLMFPTIYGIALKGLGDDAKLGASGLIMAIGGGCLMPPLQAAIMDMDAFNIGPMVLSSTRVSFLLPWFCFVVIALFGFRTHMLHQD
jgi:FHS family L-fucose permease-like MFS transporter